MEAGNEFEFDGLRLKAEKERSEYSCEGCFLKFVSSKGETGCLAKSGEMVFAHCKCEHLIFVGTDQQKAHDYAERRRMRVQRR